MSVKQCKDYSVNQTSPCVVVFCKPADPIVLTKPLLKRFAFLCVRAVYHDFDFNL